MALTLNSNTGTVTAPGLPTGSNIPSNGSGNALSADTFPDWSGYLLPTSLVLVNGGSVVSFPAIIVKEDQSNALVIHTYPNLDSGRTENMGRNPAIFHIKVMLTNNIYPNTTEKWMPGSLFPTVFENLVNILLNTTTQKTLVHPVYGPTTVDVQTWTYELNSKGPRDGVIVDMVLVETIATNNNPLSNQLTPPAGSGLQLAANALDNIVISPPGLSLSGFFGQISNVIASIASIPNQVVGAITAPINTVITGVAQLSNTLGTTPGYIASSVSQDVQSTKEAVFGATISKNNAIAYYSSAVINASSSNPAVSGVVSDPSSSKSLVSSFLALNNQPSQNSFQLINKTMIAVSSLMQYYIDQNNSKMAPSLEAAKQYLLQLQQVQSALSANTSAQAVKVMVYITPTITTWTGLASYLNNSVDGLLSLNQGLINDFTISANTRINYYQSV